PRSPARRPRRAAASTRRAARSAASEMAWKKSPPELVRAFDRLVPATRAVERRTMFGYPAAFVGGNMFAGLHEDRFVLRLGDEDLADAKRLGAKDFEPMPRPALKGWLSLREPPLAGDCQAAPW